MHQPNIPAKANKVLNYILLALILILVRIWYLGLFQHETYLELSKKPKIKTQLHPSVRGTIYDRFMLPLAVNKIHYFASILYEEIREIPKVKWIKEKNKKIKTYPRKEYIKRLAQLLASELNLDPLDIEDIIYGKAALFPSTPILVKDNLTEKQYYRLKALQKDFQGLIASRKAKRYYPQNKIAADLIGFIGQVSEKEYFAKQLQFKTLQNYLKSYQEHLPVFLPPGFPSVEKVKLEVEKTLDNPLLLTDLVGQSGLEKHFNDELKGFCGKSTFEVDTNGKNIRTLPGVSPPISGKRLVLNISSELQGYAEALLAENEKIRDEKFSFLGKDNHKVPKPWIKGGSIVAIVPKTGEIVCMASYPRINSNDFSMSKEKPLEVSKWLESPHYLCQLWDGKNFLEREYYCSKTHQFLTNQQKLTLPFFLNTILSPRSSVKKAITSLQNLQEGFHILQLAHKLLDLSEQPFMYMLIDSLYPKDNLSVFNTSKMEQKLTLQALAEHEEYFKMLKKSLDPYLFSMRYNDDKLLFLDLLRLLTFPDEKESPAFPLDQLSLESHRTLSQAFCIIKDELYSQMKNIFHSHHFKVWREDSFHHYLKERRREEKQQKKPARPYIDYLAKAEKDLFQLFWNNYKWELINAFIFETPTSHYELKDTLPKLSPLKNYPLISTSLRYFHDSLSLFSDEEKRTYLKSLRSYKDLSFPLYGYYSQIKKPKMRQTLQDLARSFYPPQGFGFGRSFAYRQSTPLGSIFKVVTAYEAIKQTQQKQPNLSGHHLNPLTITDEIQPHLKTSRGTVLGLNQDGQKITRFYKGGTLPRSHTRLGRIDYIQAMERSSNVYFSLLASDIIADPNDLLTTSFEFGFGNKTGIDLPGEIPGALPKDLSQNRSGLYSFAIGQHSLIATPLQTAVMLSSLCNDGEVLKPQIIRKTIGKEKESLNLLHPETPYPYQDYLNEIGLFFPFFLEAQKDKSYSRIKFYPKQLHRKLYLPHPIKNYLLESLHSVVSSARGNARAEIIHYFRDRPQALKNYVKLRHKLAGKTSTAEIMYNPTLDRECSPIITKDIWFGGVSFKQKTIDQKVISTEEEPELCVVVYLKFGDYGKEAAPLASEIITKYRQLCEKYK